MPGRNYTILSMCFCYQWGIFRYDEKQEIFSGYNMNELKTLSNCEVIYTVQSCIKSVIV
jgi:hypothetical protein